MVVGAGPSGVYAADEIVRAQGWRVDIIDRLPTPYGLLRYGVAPDHLRMKSLSRALERVFQHEEVRFLGNVQVGRDVTVSELRERYDAIVYAVGAPGYRQLNIPGEGLDGVLPSTSFVSWYSGHPDAVTPVDLSTVTSVAVLGAGNVALDVARVLAKSASELSHTDIPSGVLERLETSRVEDIHVFARRGPADVKFTFKELAEFGELLNAGVVVHADPEELGDEPGQAPAGSTVLDLFRQWKHQAEVKRARTVHFHFGLTPTAIQGDERVRSVSFTDTLTGEARSFSADLALVAVGSLGRSLDDVPFDSESGVIPHTEGRVHSPDRHGREYVVGWIKRGPSGVIGVNRADAAATVATLVADLESVTPQARPLTGEDLPEMIEWSNWLDIDAAEVDAGTTREAARVKLSSWQDLLKAARR
ncbi:FAD-dependent oxidoreductase [Aeromicrobium sp. YIM 150415]|uniref:FAD-dependent oxidoreductase n=1 Tax=Aeromicrobium sp. YIM 150415 TaxID=2803912 RepID=UPI0027DDB2CE|nr:FAD-dependent oxidoreductase [Aeromicrobium sp. YIM 150415]